MHIAFKSILWKICWWKMLSTKKYKFMLNSEIYCNYCSSGDFQGNSWLDLSRWFPGMNGFTQLHSERPKQAYQTILEYILLTQAFSWKYLNEKCWSEAKKQHSFKYFVNLCFIPTLFTKVWEKQAVRSRGTLSVNGLSMKLLAYLLSLCPIFWRCSRWTLLLWDSCRR